MLKPIDLILFATDLTPGCQQAYEFAVAMAIRNKALLYILYIIEQIPESIEGRFKGLVGKHEWKELMQAKKDDIHKSLTGKRLSSQVLEEIQEFCEKVGMDEESCAFHSREVIISAGDIAETIIKTAEENECDIIILGSQRGMLGRNSVGSSIKSVLKLSPIPVTVVPTDAQ
jgi:nucleotide-binding universal stress UspA family protein